ncbi:MAG: hypothetical protein DHS20C08_08930 [Rhodomicrobium sp.]|nr:MAG: hypothetical protein DHS20C08_08930 [Rhodomicrobium sp.]
MDVTLKLYATLTPFLPSGAEKNQISIDVSEGSSVMDIVDKYQLPKESCHLILVNGNYTPLASADQKILVEGDTLAIWPPVAGG